MHDARGDLDLPSSRGDLVTAVDVEANDASQDLEALGDVGVHVLAGDRSAGPDVEVAHEELAACVLASLTHNETVALDTVLVDLARSHVDAPC